MWKPSFLDRGAGKPRAGLRSEDEQGGEVPTWLVLGGMLLVGLIVRFAAEELHDPLARVHWFAGWAAHIVELFADGLVVAALLGLAVDTALKSRLQREVFRATFGYLLPRALRSAMVWLYSQRIICIHCRVWIVLHPHEDGNSVDMNVTMTRQLRNVSGAVATLRPLLAMDNSVDVKIHRMTVRRGDQTLRATEDAGSEFQTGLKMADIPVASGEQVVVEYEWTETRHSNDVYHETWLNATIDPVITVRAPSTLLVSVGATTTLDRMQERKLGDDLTEWSLRGADTLLPGQGIVVRWRTKEALAAEERTAGVASEPEAEPGG